MKKKILSYLLKTLLPAGGIVLSVFFSFNVLGCGSTVSGLNMLGGDFSLPRIEAFKLEESDLLQMKFSRNVNICQMSVIQDPGLEEKSEVIDCSCQIDEDGQVKIKLNKEMIPGREYQLDGTVKDEKNNILSFSLPFKGYNSRIPKLIISEVRNAYGYSTVKKVKHYKTEFIELFVLEDGNLAGVKIISALDGEEKAYYCPAVEVKAGSYVTIHMRTISKDKIKDEIIKDETDGNLNSSYSQDTSSSAVDLWSENETAVFGVSDVIAVINSQTSLPMDALLYESREKAFDNYSSLAETVNSAEIWEGEPFDASNVASTAVTRSISRQNVKVIYSDFKAGKYPDGKIPVRAEDYVVVKTVTPGAPNSSEAYVKK